MIPLLDRIVERIERDRTTDGTLEGQGYTHMGPGGVDYLKTTLDKVFFPLLWEARTFIERT